VSDTFTRYGSNITNVWKEILTPVTLAFSCKVVPEKLWKSVNICKSYGEKISGTFFIWTRCNVMYWLPVSFFSAHTKCIAIVSSYNDLSVENIRFHRFYPPQSRLKPSQKVLPGDQGYKCWCQKLESLGNPRVKAAWSCVHLSPLNTSVWRTDRRTDGRALVQLIAKMWRL